MNKTLYEQDYYLWLQETVKTLDERRLSELDIQNLIAEIADMGINQKKSVKSNLIVIIWHLLKYKYEPERRSKSWQLTLLEHRDRLIEDFENSPSLKPYFYQIFDQCYHKAKQKASIETGLPLSTFPDMCPFTTEEILNLEYLPE